jgi:glucose/mannose-6-phosphate isomerase
MGNIRDQRSGNRYRKLLVFNHDAPLILGNILPYFLKASKEDNGLVGDERMPDVSILDRIDDIKKIDKSDMLGHCLKTSQYSRDVVERAEQIKLPAKVNVSRKVSIKYKNPRQIVITGMGGSAIGGEILRDWLRDELPIPIEISSDYTLPAYTNKDTLVFAISHSGETEETLSSFVDALRKKCMIVSITSGGHMLSFSRKLSLPFVQIPGGLPPRAAIPFLFFPLPILLEKIGALSNVREEVDETIGVMKSLGEANSPKIPVKDNLAKKLALELMGTVPVVYGFKQYNAIAHRLKTQFNENSKVVSKYDVFPELNHNEVVGWEAPEALTKHFSVIVIRDRDKPAEIRRRIEATKSLALKGAKKVLEVYASGEGRLAKMFSVLHMGDFVSVYLAILQNKDPTPVKTISAIKEEMRKEFSVIDKVEDEIRKIVT